MKKMQIAVVPSESTNSYTASMKRILGNLFVVSPFRFKHCLKIHDWALVRSYDAIILSWRDNAIVGHNGNVSYLGIVKYFSEILLLKLLVKRVIFVRHNKFPHHIKQKNIYRVMRIINWSEKLYDLVFIHSGTQDLEGRLYVPHPLYFRGLSDLEINVSRESYYVVFGRVERYKKIVELISELSSDLKLIVIGKCKDAVYKNEILASINGKNVELIDKFLSDEEASIIIRKSNGVVIAADSADMIVSGSFFFSVSLGVPVYAIKSEFLEWLNSEHSFPGLYIYDSISSLASSLNLGIGEDNNQKNITEAAQLFFGDEVVLEKIKIAFEKTGIFF